MRTHIPCKMLADERYIRYFSSPMPAEAIIAYQSSKYIEHFQHLFLMPEFNAMRWSVKTPQKFENDAGYQDPQFLIPEFNAMRWAVKTHRNSKTMRAIKTHNNAGDQDPQKFLHVPLNARSRDSSEH